VPNTDLANYNGSRSWNDSPEGVSREETTNVGSFPPNPWELHDTHGNVAEWCADWYGPYAGDDQTDPCVNRKRSNYNNLVLRGGSWVNFSPFCRAAHRGAGAPAYRSLDCGFRVCFRLD
jgi:formylglycine-generating enzyme required for sulfatase activity